MGWMHSLISNELLNEYLKEHGIIQYGLPARIPSWEDLLQAGLISEQERKIMASFTRESKRGKRELLAKQGEQFILTLVSLLQKIQRPETAEGIHFVCSMPLK